MRQQSLLGTVFFLSLGVAWADLVPPAAPLNLSRTPRGYTELVQSADTRVIYVSSSQGSDANAGVSPDRPVKTLEQGASLLRDGYPDWMLLRRGDVWTENFNRWKLSGRSLSEPMVISGYGEGPRPVLTAGIMIPSGYSDNPSRGHIAFVGLEFRANTSAQDAAAIYWRGDGQDLLVEDCLFRHYGTNIILRTVDDNTVIENVRVRRCVIADAFSTAGHSQGLFAAHVDQLLIEDNVFDHNGWHESIGGAEATVFNHNVYMKECNDVIIQNNIFARASALGVKVSSDKFHGSDNVLIENNLFVDNGYGIGLNGTTVYADFSHYRISIRHNVVTRTGRVMGNDLEGYGILIVSGDTVTVDDNLLIRKNHDGVKSPITVGNHPQRTIALRDNILQDWEGNYSIRIMTDDVDQVAMSGNLIELGNNAYVDASRSVTSYNQMVGGESTLESFFAEARKQSKQLWRPEYTAAPILAYMFEGFTLIGTGQ